MRWFTFLPVLLLIQVLNVFAANILIIHVYPAKTFSKILNSVIHPLAKYHQITLYSNQYRDFPHPNVTVVEVGVTIKNIFESDTCKYSSYYLSLIESTYFISSNIHIENVYNDSNISKLVNKNGNATYDLLIVPTNWAECFYQIAHVYQIPLVQLSSLVIFVQANEAISNPLFLTTYYNYVFFEDSINFFTRVRIYIKNMIRIYLDYRKLQAIDKFTKDLLPAGTPSSYEMNLNTSLVISNTNIALGYIRPNMPFVLDIGGIHCKPPKRLPQELEDFISGAGEYGFIYFSLGTSVSPKIVEKKERLFIEVFKKLPQRVLWKWHNGNIKDLPSNIKISNMFPQDDILGHPKIKLFISQAGMLSMLESVFHGVPVLAMPLIFDQMANAYLAKEMGYSENINFCTITEEIFLSNIQKMISDSKYKSKVLLLSSIMKDEIENVEERLINKINYIIKHKGDPLKPLLTSTKYSGFQRMDLDVVLFLNLSCLLLIISTIFLIYKLFKLAKMNMTKKEKKS